MKDKLDTTWKLFIAYVLVLTCMLASNVVFGQIHVSQFNAEWNKANGIDWVQDLKECKTISYVDISTNPDLQAKHKIAVIPIIIIFKDGVEVARCQADLSLKRLATRKEIQNELNN